MISTHEIKQNELASFNVSLIRQDFPILNLRIHEKPLVYLDNAATSQKPQKVIDAITNYYLDENSNIHRGVHWLSEKATAHYESSRENVRRFLNARSGREIIFTRGATEGINLAARSWGEKFLKEGDEILISGMEHHSNIVPWQILCQRTGATLKIIPVTDSGQIEMDVYERLLNERTRLVSIVHVSNVLGTINPVQQMIQKAHDIGALTLLDGAQSIPHIPVDVQTLDCDFFVFSGHKLFAPTGIGALYAKEEILEQMDTYQSGGDMIRSVTFEKTIYNSLPHRFEAGTPNIEGAIGLGAAIAYLEELDLEGASLHEQALLEYGEQLLSEIPGLKIIGTASQKTGVISFILDGIHPHDIGTILDQEGIAIRTGHHCCQPLMERFGIPATARASLAFYNTKVEMDILAASVKKVIRLFQ
jgi:cysteine desulfurase/selenocysteine lyase